MNFLGELCEERVEGGRDKRADVCTDGTRVWEKEVRGERSDARG